jgi:REP element-mobilizing transposase RayT
MLAKKIRQSKNQGLAARRAVAVMIDQSKYNLCSRQRRSIRLKGYDYSQVGAYSITICTYKHECLFGEIENREMRLNAYGSIAKHQWEQLSEQFKEIELGEFVIMPNHIHGIVIIQNPHIKTEIEDKIVGAGPAPARSQSNIGQPQGFGQPQGLPLRRKTIGDIVGAYKSLVANECLKI